MLRLLQGLFLDDLSEHLILVVDIAFSLVHADGLGALDAAAIAVNILAGLVPLVLTLAPWLHVQDHVHEFARLARHPIIWQVLLLELGIRNDFLESAMPVVAGADLLRYFLGSSA